jgi:hypothetical protein
MSVTSVVVGNSATSKEPADRIERRGDVDIQMGIDSVTARV